MEVVYMVEVETLCCTGPIMSLLQLKEVIFNCLRDLIHTIPSSYFGELGLWLELKRGINCICRGMYKLSQLENYELSLQWKMKLWARLSAPQDLWILWIYKVQPQDVLEPWILGSRVQLQDFVSFAPFWESLALCTQICTFTVHMIPKASMWT